MLESYNNGNLVTPGQPTIYIPDGSAAAPTAWASLWVGTGSGTGQMTSTTMRSTNNQTYQDVINAGTSMARQEGVVTMTETASELAETSKTRTNNYSRRKGCVTGTKSS